MIKSIETVWIPMPDGANLAARIWMPETAGKTPAPAILEYIPYRRRDQTRMRDESMHPVLAEAGYVSIRVDMRGSGDSDGLMLDEYTDIEIQDGVDVIAWIADQPWCDGNVGMFGKSWGAYTSFQVAAKQPPALKAIAPVMGTDDRWLEDVHFYGGVLANDNFWWGSIMQLYNALPPDPAVVGDKWRQMWKERLDNMCYWPALWLEHQTHDEMWRRGSISEDYDSIRIPVYFFGGWADLFRDTPFRIAQKLKSPVKILMGPWAHLYPHEAVPSPRMDFMAELIRYWDHYLKGDDTGLMDEPRFRFYVQDSTPPSSTRTTSEGVWVEDSEWPFRQSHDQVFHLNNGHLGAAPAAGEPMRIRSPQTFGSAGGDMCSFAIPGDMPADCRIDAAGALSFATPPLEDPLAILGQPSVTARISADKPQGFVCALLVDEAPDGAQTLITRGFANLMHRHSDTDPQPVTPGEEMEITIPLHGIGYRLAKGHRLMVQIASTYWPMLWPSPEPVTLTITPGVSCLHLPVCETAETAGRVLDEPDVLKATGITTLREGSMERSVKTDLMTGEHISRFFTDGGVFGPVGQRRIDETGTVMSSISDRIYRIHPDDPLSARAVMDQECVFERDDWNFTIKTTASMTADKDSFILHATVTCLDGDAIFHEVEWNHKIDRKGM
ncbi:MAG: CocE/NonD family hydrolase [Parvularculales bacterium]